MEKFNNECQYLLHLIKSVLNDTQPEEKPEELSFEKILRIARKHDVANIAYYGVEKLKIKPENELNRKWAEARDKAIIRELTQTYEFDVLTNALVKENIRHLCLKGIWLKELYPQRDMRTMSDIDLLVDDENTVKISKIMNDLGYELMIDEDADDDHHDAYRKKPIMLVEMHRQLFGANGNVYHEILPDPWVQAFEATPFAWRFNESWSFLYIFAHLEKHYSKQGTGIRSIMDIYVYLKHKEKELDWEYIYSELDKVGKSQICRDIIQLSKIWFGDAETSPKYEKMASFIFGSGLYGNKMHSILNNYNRMSKKKYFLFRLFPPMIVMNKKYPVLKKAPVLLPVFWIVRMVSIPLFKGKNIKKEITFIKDNK